MKNAHGDADSPRGQLTRFQSQSRHRGTYSVAPSVESPTPHSVAFASAPLRRPAYNVLAVITQGEPGADFLEKNICKTNRHVRSPR